MQVANDVASLNELPSCEARPGRRVNNSASGKLQGGELREDCVEGALERGLAGGERGVYLQRKSVHRGEQGGQRAGVRLADEGGVQGCRGDGAQESRRYLRVHLGGSVHGRLQGVRGQRAGVRLGGLQPRDGGVSARELAPRR